MKVAIHQPEHFPYMGFFEKMKSSDLFVILDDVQYKKNNSQHFSSSEEIREFFEDGVKILDYFKKK